MYRAIVRARTRAVWRAIDAHDADAPAEMAADDLRFTFVGDTPLGAELVGRDAFRTWLQGVFTRFDDISFQVLDVAVHGWPWHTSRRAAGHLGHAARRHALPQPGLPMDHTALGPHDGRLGARGHPGPRRRLHHAGPAGGHEGLTPHWRLPCRGGTGAQTRRPSAACLVRAARR